MSRSTHSFRPIVPLATPGQRIGLLGGSFNPPHEGHLLISEIALRQLQLDAIWWLVSPGNPLKNHSELALLSDRVEAARRLAAHPRIFVTSFEVDLGSPYTVDTLAFLKARHPGIHFIWLMGADNLATVHRWRNWRAIFRSMPVAVINRPGWHLKALASPAARTFARGRIAPRRAALMQAPLQWTFLTGPLSNQSSTALRTHRKRLVNSPAAE